MNGEGRYSTLPVRRRQQPGGPTVLFRARRFVPSPRHVPSHSALTVSGRERVDQIAARRLGNPLAWWRLCDANIVLEPGDLERDIGRTVRISDLSPPVAP